MAPPKATPRALEGFYNVKQATERLGLSDPDNPEDTTGQRWLRDGVNLEGWPHHRMAGYLMFSDTDLAEIARLSRNPTSHSGRKPAVPRQRSGRTSPRNVTAPAASR